MRRLNDEFHKRWELRMGAVSPPYWVAVIEMQLRRLDAGVHAHQQRRLHPDRRSKDDGFGAAFSVFGPLEVDAYMLLIAMRHLLTIGELYAERYDTQTVLEARDAFLEHARDAKGLRDVLSHLEHYAIGRGHNASYEASGTWWIQLGIDPPRNRVDVRAGKLHIEMMRAAGAAIDFGYRLTAIALEGTESPPDATWEPS